jgi:hypothetical protein
LQKYLKAFPRADRSKAVAGSFWPNEYAYLGTQMEDPKEIQDTENVQHGSEASRAKEVVNNHILALLLDPTPQGFFGPKRLKPSMQQ